MSRNEPRIESPDTARHVYWARQAKGLTVDPSPEAIAFVRAEIEERVREADLLFVELEDSERDELAEMVAAAEGEPCPFLIERLADMKTGRP